MRSCGSLRRLCRLDRTAPWVLVTVGFELGHAVEKSNVISEAGHAATWLISLSITFVSICNLRRVRSLIKQEKLLDRMSIEVAALREAGEVSEEVVAAYEEFIVAHRVLPRYRED